MPKILDNIKFTTEPELLTTLKSSYRLDAAIGYFNLRGWSLLADAVDALPDRGDEPKARVLVGMQESGSDEMRRLARHRHADPVDPEIAQRLRGETLAEYRQQLQIGLPTVGDESSLRRLLRQIESGDVEVRVHTEHRLHAKLYLCHREDTAAPRVGYVGSSNLTVAGLREQGELNVDVVEGDATEKLGNWFEDRWNNDFTVPAMPELAETLRESWASEIQLDPYLIYLKMAYHLSREAREGLIEYGLPASMKDELLDFQAAAVKIAARIVMQKGGAMIGDVVGLGKTLVGTAVARLLQEEQGYETLVVCPKNLTDMWDDYLHKYEVRGRVESLSMVHKTLPDARRYRLVIVDEAHNLRSDKRRDHRVLQAYIADNDSKALLLTATPYNKEFGDLAAQLSLFLRADAELGLRPELAIAEKGESEFENLCEGMTSSLSAFKRSEHLADWQALMSQYLVRRTRRFVEDNYALEDEHGRRYLEFGSGSQFYFPKRTARPVDRNLTADDPAAVMASDETLETIDSLLLPRYSIGDYIDEGYIPANSTEEKLRRDLKDAAAGNLIGFTRVTMYKRLSSSGPAFIATLHRHRLRNLVAAHALENGLPVPIGSVDKALWLAESDLDQEDLDEDGDHDSLFWSRDETAFNVYRTLQTKNPKAIRWAPPEMFDDDLLDHLLSDSEVIAGLLREFGKWNPANDGKMAALEMLLTHTHPTDKVLVFTEAADTADYILDELRRRGVSDTEKVTGDSENPTALARRFSPHSNQVSADGGAPMREIRVLISTDVLSEGQNLQDSHVIVNYDLPWAIVKLVQRAGRVDRIGQDSPEVLVYSLLPEASVEEEIRVRERIRDRLGENAKLLGSDEAFFGDKTEQEILTGVYDESSARIQVGAEDVDPVSMAYEIWRHASDDHKDLAQRAAELQNSVYSTKAIASKDQEAGVLVHTQKAAGADAFAFVELGGQERRVTPQEALRLAECDPQTPPATRLEDHHELTAAAIVGPLRTPEGRHTGALQGVRGKVWKRLHEHMDTFQDNLLFNRADITAAHEAMNEHPLYEGATQRLARAVKDRNIDDLAALVVELHNDGRLCIPPPQDDRHAEPTIICTMGFR